MKNFADCLYNKIKEKQAPVVLKLNPVWDSIPEFIKEKYKNSGTPIVMFNKIIIDCINETVPAIMMNVTTYLRYGMGGILAMKATEMYAKEKNLTVFYDSDLAVSPDVLPLCGETYFNEITSDKSGDIQSSTFSGDALSLSLSDLCGIMDANEIFGGFDKYLSEGRGLFINYSKNTVGSSEVLKNIRMTYERYAGEKMLSSLGIYMRNPSKTEVLAVRKEMKRMYIMIDHGECDALAFDEYGKGGLIVLGDNVVYAYKSPKYAGKYDEKSFIEAMKNSADEIIDKINGAV